MDEIVTLVEPNPAVFFQDLESNINQGFYADDSVLGYPIFGTLNQIILTERPEPEHVAKFEGDEVLVQEYDNTLLVLAVQDAILQGYTVDLNHILLNQFCAPHEIRLTRKVAPTFALAPAKPDPVPEPTPEAPNVPQEPTEAPAPRNKGGRPPKKAKEE